MAPITFVFDLSPSEKLQLVEVLWDDLAASPDLVPVHQWQKDELAARKARLAANPASAVSWEWVKQRIHGNHDESCEMAATTSMRSRSR